MLLMGIKMQSTLQSGLFCQKGINLAKFFHCLPGICKIHSKRKEEIMNPIILTEHTTKYYFHFRRDARTVKNGWCKNVLKSERFTSQAIQRQNKDKLYPMVR